jgi:integrase/recombinase XerD
MVCGKGPTSRLLTTMYAAGPRVSEVAHLRVGDIDNIRKVLWIRGGKRRKDRQTLLPPTLLELLHPAAEAWGGD